MKKLIFGIGLLSVLTALGQNQNFRQTYVYEGNILTDKNEQVQIKLNFLILLDSTMIGSYYYNPSWGSLKLIGRFNADYSFHLVERDKMDSVTGFFQGNLSSDYKTASGKWIDKKREKSYQFNIKQIEEKSYWDYIKKNRALYEYTDIEKAIKEKDEVQSMDIAHQELNKLPKKLSKLKKIVSINLLGNKFQSFPIVLSKLTTLDEISLSSNQLTYVRPEIGKLKNLRILIMNYNQLKELPREIGELTNLLYLEIGNNQLTSLPDEIKYLTSLQELYINRNKLSETEKQRIQKLLPQCIIHF